MSAELPIGTMFVADDADSEPTVWVQTDMPDRPHPLLMKSHLTDSAFRHGGRPVMDAADQLWNGIVDWIARLTGIPEIKTATARRDPVNALKVGDRVKVETVGTVQDVSLNRSRPALLVKVEGVDLWFSADSEEATLTKIVPPREPGSLWYDARGQVWRWMPGEGQRWQESWELIGNTDSEGLGVVSWPIRPLVLGEPEGPS